MTHLVSALKDHIARYTRFIGISLYVLACSFYLIAVAWLVSLPDAFLSWQNVSLFVFVSFCYFYLYRILEKRCLAAFISELAALERIENWAESVNEQHNELSKLPTSHSNDIMVTAINTLVEKVAESKNNALYLEQAIRENSLLDAETGIGNRQFFDNRLDALLREKDIHGAVFFIQFKECDVIQAMYGQAYFVSLLDMMIQSIKYSLKNQVGYFIARRNEFELAILIPSIYLGQTEKIAKLLLKGLLNVQLPVGVDRDEFTHIGVSYFNAKQKPYQIMAEADMALRNAQLQGPSQWFMYDVGEVEQKSAKGSLRWRTFLLKAMNKNAFVIFFQPIIASAEQKILHHEVLSKVRDGDGSLINARVFIPMARKCGLNQEVDLLICEQVFKIMSYEKVSAGDCSINISIESLLSAQFVEHLLAMLTEYESIANQVLIEVSEYHLVHHLQDIKPVLETLVSRGIRIVADKVGQYVVSANYLETCPIAYVKLHRSIVLGIDEKPENQIFVQSIKALTTPKNIQIYALGVESDQEWRMLKHLGVVGGQGHFFTEPIAHVAPAALQIV